MEPFRAGMLGPLLWLAKVLGSRLVLEVLLRLSLVGALFIADVSPIVEPSSILLATEESLEAYGSYPDAVVGGL